MTEQKKANKVFSGAVIGLSIVVIIATFGLGGWIYKRVLKDLAVRAKCPPSVVGVNQGQFRMTTRAVVKKVPTGAKVLDLWMPYPESRINQIVTNVVVKSPYPVQVAHEKEYGNAVLHARVANPKKDFEVSIDFSVIRSENMAAKFIDRNVYQLKDAGDYGVWKRYDKVGALTPLLKGLSERLTRDKPNNVDKAKAIYDYMAKTYIYDYDKKNLPTTRGDLSVFCQTKKGRCTELSTLFGTLARAAGIPVKYVSGYTLRNHEPGEVGGHCCWVEFFAPGYGWLPVDLSSAKKFPQDTEYYFGNTDEWRVELVTGRDLILEPPQKGPRINAWIDPYAEVDGKIFTVGKRVSWKKEF